MDFKTLFIRAAALSFGAGRLCRPSAQKKNRAKWRGLLCVVMS